MKIAVGTCEQCEMMIYSNEASYRFKDEGKVKRVHESCFLEYAEEHFQAEVVDGVESILDD